MKCKMETSFFSDLMFKISITFVFLVSLILPCIVGNNNLVSYDHLLSEKVSTCVKSTGSTSMSHVLSILSDEFMLRNEGFTYEKSESGSGAAPMMVSSGGSDLGDMSRDLYESEQKDFLVRKCIALDGIVVVLNNENKIRDLSKDTLKDIFTKKIVDWSQVSDDFNGKIVTIGREDGSGTKSGFEKCLDLKNVNYDLILSESGDISAKISNEPRAIGYISLASVFGKIHDISIDSVYCTLENIKNGSYLLTRPFIQIYDKNVKNEARDKWMQFLKSDCAKELVEKEKLVYVFEEN